MAPESKKLFLIGIRLRLDCDLIKALLFINPYDTQRWENSWGIEVKMPKISHTIISVEMALKYSSISGPIISMPDNLDCGFSFYYWWVGFVCVFIVRHLLLFLDSGST